MNHIRYRIGILALMLALLPGLAAACGGFFSRDEPVIQSGQQIIFTIDQATRTVSATVAISYTGAAEEFAWVIPVPNNPKVEVAPIELFTDFVRATSPVYLLPQEQCDASDWQIGAGGSIGGSREGVNIYQTGQVGPYDYVVLGGDTSTELSTWLRENGYRITPEMEPVLQLYSAEKMLFLAMKLQQGEDVGSIQPVKMTFSADRPMLPLRFSAVAAQPATQVRVWVLSNTQVRPENLKRLVIPDEQILVTDWDGHTNYAQVAKETLQSVNNQGLILEYAMPISDLASTHDQRFQPYIERYGYVTRFYGEFNPEQMLVDPVFIPDPTSSDLPRYHNLQNRVSPYNCITHTLLPDNLQPLMRTTPLGFLVEYGWCFWCLAIPIALVWVSNTVRRRRRNV